jgi:BMFP domain-containing protein YqiC
LPHQEKPDANAQSFLRRPHQDGERRQIAKILDGMDIPRRDEFDAVKAMAAKAREENEELKKQIAELQARLLNTGP